MMIELLVPKIPAMRHYFMKDGMFAMWLRFSIRRLKSLIFLLLGVVVISGVGVASGYLDAPREQTIFTAPVVRGSIDETVLATGTLEPVQMVNVGAQVSGQVKTLAGLRCHTRWGRDHSVASRPARSAAALSSSALI
jgi:hypothetical protein